MTPPMLKHTFLAIVALLLSVSVQAQDDPEYRFEIGAGVGLTGYLGDYNGKLTRDLQPAASIAGRYNFNPWMALRINVGYGKLKGSSDDVKTWYTEEQYRSYSFSNSLTDIAAIYEYNFLPYGTGRDYRGAKRLTPFVFGGSGLVIAKTTEKTRMGGQLLDKRLARWCERSLRHSEQRIVQEHRCLPEASAVGHLQFLTKVSEL